jgi:ankyrin repeat protein
MFPVHIYSAVIDLLLCNSAHLGRSGALGASARLGNEFTTRRLLDRGARPGTDSVDGGSSLHVAVRAGHIGVPKVLMEYLANPNAVDNNGNTPLGIAEKMIQEGNNMSEWLGILRKRT